MSHEQNPLSPIQSSPEVTSLETNIGRTLDTRLRTPHSGLRVLILLVFLAAQSLFALSPLKLTDPGQIESAFQASPTNRTAHVLVTLAAATGSEFRVPGSELRAPTRNSELTTRNSRLAAFRALFREAQQEVLDALPAEAVTPNYRYDNLAAFSAHVTTNGLQALQADSRVLTIEPVLEVHPHTAQGMTLMHALVHRSQFPGQGVAIAICDTGVDYRHPRLGGNGPGSVFPNSKVIGGYDLGDGDGDPLPNTQAHGTACAGIAAGNLEDPAVNDYAGGVAWGAKLYALKITPGTGGSSSTAAIAAAWDWCVTHQYDDPEHPLLVISTSFGAGKYSTACDSVTPALAAAANNAVAAGITVLVSSGNDGYCNALASPACLTAVLSVASVYDAALGNLLPCVSGDSCASKIAGGCTTGWYVNDTTAPDKVAAYANVSSQLSLFAPADQASTLDIIGLSGYAGGDYYGSFGGTSAACPYAAGAVAMLQNAAKAVTGAWLTPEAVKDLLMGGGDLVTDVKVAITKPRVNVERAIAGVDTNLVARFVAGPTNGGAPMTVTFTNQSANAMNYLWDFGDGNISTHTHPVHTYTNAGSYTVQLAAIQAGTTNTLIRPNYIVLSNTAPAILVQPASQNVNAGANVVFSVNATGTPPLTYQWKLNGTNIPGATATSRLLTNVQPADMGTYSVIVSNVAGAVASFPADLMVVVVPGLITVAGVPYTQDFNSMGNSGITTPFGWYVGTGTGAVSSTTVTVGSGSSNGRANYNFGATGSPDRALGSLAGDSTQRNTEGRFVNVSGFHISSFTITYTGEQWRRGGNNAVNNQLVLQYSTDGENFTPLGGAFDFNTPIDSGGATALDGNSPVNRVTGIGGTFTPAHSIANGKIFFLRWADVDDPRADHGIAVDDLVVTFELTNVVPVITLQPLSHSVGRGEDVIFSVEATGVPPLSYQWQFGSTNIAGATTATLLLTNVQPADAGGYLVIVANDGGATTSTVAVLTVNMPPSANFLADPTNGLAPMLVSFTNASANATGYVWNFGDGNSSTNVNPLNTYTNHGIYTVTLTATGAGGTNSLARINYIVVLIPAQMSVSPAVLEFGNVLAGGSAQATLVISNGGGVMLSGNATIGTGAFSLVDRFEQATSVGFDVPPAGASNVMVGFAPDGVGVFSNAVMLVSNGGAFTNPVTGTGVGAPVILGPALEEGEFRFGFETAAGLNYEVQFKRRLKEELWQTLEVVAGDGSVKTVKHAVGPAGNGFYRIRVLSGSGG